MNEALLASTYRKELIKILKTKLKDSTLTQEEKSFLKDIQSLIKKKDVSMIDIAIIANEKIKRDKNLQSFEKNIDAAKFPFSGDKNSLNSKNCNDNHTLLRKVCCQQLGYEYPPKTTEEIKNVDKMYDTILNGWIIPGYLSYVGHDRAGNPLEQKPTIINDTEKMQELKKVLSSKSGVAIVLNMCSTDYTADVVYSILDNIQQSENISESKKQISKVLPKTEHNYYEKKKQIRNLTKHLFDNTIRF